MISCILELQMTCRWESGQQGPLHRFIATDHSFYFRQRCIFSWNGIQRGTLQGKKEGEDLTQSHFILHLSLSLLGCKRLLLPPLTIKSQSLYLKVYHWYRNKSFPLDRIISVDGEKKHWRCSDEGEQIKSCFFSCHKIVIVSTSLKGIMLFSRKKIISRERKMFLDGLQLWQ